MHIRRRKIQISPPLGDHNHSKGNQIPNRSLLLHSLPFPSAEHGRNQRDLACARLFLGPTYILLKNSRMHLTYSADWVFPRPRQLYIDRCIMYQQGQGLGIYNSPLSPTPQPKRALLGVI